MKLLTYNVEVVVQTEQNKKGDKVNRFHFARQILSDDNVPMIESTSFTRPFDPRHKSGIKKIVWVETNEGGFPFICDGEVLKTKQLQSLPIYTRLVMRLKNLTIR